MKSGTKHLVNNSLQIFSNGSKLNGTVHCRIPLEPMVIFISILDHCSVFQPKVSSMQAEKGLLGIKISQKGTWAYFLIARGYQSIGFYHKELQLKVEILEIKSMPLKDVYSPIDVDFVLVATSFHFHSRTSLAWPSLLTSSTKTLMVVDFNSPGVLGRRCLWINHSFLLKAIFSVIFGLIYASEPCRIKHFDMLYPEKR